MKTKLNITKECFKCKSLNPEAHGNYKCHVSQSCPDAILSPEEKKRLLQKFEEKDPNLHVYKKYLKVKYNILSKPIEIKYPHIHYMHTDCEICGKIGKCATFKFNKDEMTTTICWHCLFRYAIKAKEFKKEAKDN